MEKVKKQIKYFNKFFKNMPSAQKAMEVALEYHCGLRKCGDPEVSHQFGLVSFLLAPAMALNKTDMEAVISTAFLHDVVEDYDYSEEQLRKDFPKKIADAVMLVTKPKGFKKIEEHYEKYHGQISRNPIATAVKLADRIHNVLSIPAAGKAFSHKRRKEYIAETREYIIPGAKMARHIDEDFYSMITNLIRVLEGYTDFLELSLCEGK